MLSWQLIFNYFIAVFFLAKNKPPENGWLKCVIVLNHFLFCR
ncbi:hypothetical protein GYH30_052207 [Glycine max]|nr:hypothetical protein GYH30_052207 [Glycine max]